MKRDRRDFHVSQLRHEVRKADLPPEPLGQLLLEDHHVRLIVFDLQAEVILKWIP
ncbi:hypothetical protein HYR99_28900 [Candidatus Poribacteria bacterium]|nr:hypothetical protein [Candidatus Poribacteria bacterium]